MKKVAAILVAGACALCVPLFAQGGADFARGEEFFIRNEPGEALPYLEKAFAANQSNVEGALYLAMCYEQLDRLDEAAKVYRAILPAGGGKEALIACNLGNIYFRKGSAGLAEQFYTQAIRYNPAYAAAWLNRANARVKAGSLKAALPDYERYLALEPDASQRSRIEQVVRLIQQEFAAEEIRRFTAAENARAAHAAAERRRQLANEAASLQAPAAAPAAVTAVEAVAPGASAGTPGADAPAPAAPEAVTVSAEVPVAGAPVTGTAGTAEAAAVSAPDVEVSAPATDEFKPE